MPLLTRKTQVAFKHESTEGTAASGINATNAAFNIFDAGFSPEIEQFERNPFRSSVGTRASIAGVKTGTINFQTEMVGGGATSDVVSAPPWGTLLESCGFFKANVDKLSGGSISGTFVVGETITGASAGSGVIYAIDGNDLYVTADQTWTGDITGGTSSATMAASGRSTDTDDKFVYGPTSTYSTSSAPSATVELRNDGVMHKIIGSRGNVTFRASTGQPVQMLFEFLGPKVATANQSMLTGISYPSLSPPTLLSAAFSTHSMTGGVLDSIEVSTNNDLQIRRDINATTGVKSTQIVSRAVGGSIDPEMTVATNATGTLDFFGKMDANAEALTKFTVGSTIGNQFKIFGPNSQFTGITPGERNGISTVSIDLAFNESTVGDDDLRILCF